MEITLPISSLLLVAIDSVGILVTLYVGLRLLSQKNRNHISIKLLGILLLLVGTTHLNDLLVTSGISNRFPWLYFTPIFYSLSIGPMFYLFIKSKYQLKLKRTDYLHLIVPTIQALVYFLIGFRSSEFKSNLWEATSFPLYLQIESFLFPVLLITYPIASLFILKENKTDIYFWSEDLKKWLRSFAMGMLIIAFVELLFFIFETLSIQLEYCGFSFVILHALTLSAFAFWIAINGFKQYFPLQLYPSTSKSTNILIDDYQFQNIENQFYSLMQKDHVYLNPDLNLQILANYLNISEKNCSYFLNQKLNSNFNTIINEYRIAAFKKKIEEGLYNTYTLTSLAYECGFNSKSTFNRAFKLECGLTPSEYVKTTQI